jgi:hypothetical protein
VSPRIPDWESEPLRRTLWRLRRRLHVSRYNVWSDLRRWFRVSVLRRPIEDLWPYEKRFFSQHGDDGILDAIFRAIGTTNEYYVEFGTQDGSERNTRYLAEHKGWTGLLMDGDYENPAINLRREFITAENINELFAKHGVPREFDLLSIDIDGNDYWVWRSLSDEYRPRVVVVEYNASWGPDERRTIEYQPDFVWDDSDYYGASLAALAGLAESKGYSLIGCESMGVNAYFVRTEALGDRVLAKTVREAYRPPAYGPKKRGHRRDASRTMIEPPAEQESQA